MLMLGAEPTLAERFETRLREGFGRCAGMRVTTVSATVRLELPAPCRLGDGHTAGGVLEVKLTPLDAPVREPQLRVSFVARRFRFDRVELDGALMEGELSADGRDLKTLPRVDKLATRTLPPAPGPRWVESAPPRDHAYDPSGDAARGLATVLTATPELVAGVGQELGRVLAEATVKGAPELVAVWALALPGAVADAGSATLPLSR
ncbi:MAG: hypothetical protein IPJ65_43665 [Archangiaceae bacterium]|nr:hypothetical protein [Archangiaceae bacterium]